MSEMKKRLLFLTLAFDTGGTEKATFDIITHLNPEKYDITLMSMYGGGYFWNQLPSYVHRKYFFPKFTRYVIRYVNYAPAWLVYRTFIHEQYDVEIACGDNQPSRVINASPNRHSKKIAWIHMDVMARGYKGWEMSTTWGRNHFYNHFDHIVNVSKNCEYSFQKYFGTQWPTCVIYNLIDVQDIIHKSEERTNKILSKECFNILCMGRLMPEKGFDRLIEAFSKIKKSSNITKCHIMIIGEGVQREKLESMIALYHLEQYIDLPGYFDNPYPILKQADLFLLTSTDESFALVVAEAMVLGVPVMATRCAGPIELLQEGKAGLLVDNSTEGIKEGLQKVLFDPQIMQWLRSIDNTKRFDWHQQMNQIEALFDS